ncbi:MAG: hypothetical protein AUJ49_01215 [Desulfovibrionaceae bacterium CG1_02_65_16]|nr:MAG: hypothetical protein AUJ49_01215 [Desulfovibrionaceae bacterium CG1_02_65_16]
MAEEQMRESRRLFAEYGNIPRFTPHTVRFLEGAFELPDVASFLYQYKSIFGADSYRFHPVDAAPVIYDCGANVGASCLYFQRRHPGARIVAYEADPVIFAYLARNMANNGCACITLRQEAVWVRNEPIRFACEGADGGCIDGPWDSVTVPGVRLRDRLAAEPRVDFLKLDIEGAETEVLLDCAETLDRVANIFVEYHSWNGQRQTMQDILGLLEARGFRYYMETICNRPTPFVDTGVDREKDLQCEIYAVRRRTEAEG